MIADCHCENRSDEAIPMGVRTHHADCFVAPPLATTGMSGSH